jgi:predicted dehydrogenase
VAERGYIPALAGLGEIELVGVADPVAERRHIAAGVAAYGDLDEMLSVARLDAAVICSPSECHLEHAAACARAGVRTLVEKPPGISLEQARKLAALVPEPAVGFNRRFARGLPIGRRAVGNPMRVTAIFDAPSGQWAQEAPGQDPLLDLGCHLVDLCCWITGTVPARARSMPSSPGRAALDVEMTDGLRLYAECGAAPAYRELLDVRGERGGAGMWRWPEPLRRQLPARLLRRVTPLVASWRAQLTALSLLVRRGEPGCLALAREAVQVMATLDAVRSSAAGGRGWVTVSASPAVR